ncbi:MAG TPA: TonB family protein [Puia sp.]|nr:TonB family protein [Puia sp.]
MKPHLTILLIFVALHCTAQDTLYYDIFWHPCTAAKASYYRIRTKTSEGWQVTDHFLNGRPQMTGLYTDDSFKIRAGTFTWYDSTGAPEHSETFVNNKENGVETRYYPNGQIRTIGKMKDDQLEGDWIGYYPSGKVSAKVTYKKGEQTRAHFYNEDGTPNKDMKKFFAESEFPGGIPYWLRFLNKTLRYPDSAVDHEIQGTVVIGFKISTDGTASDFQVVQSVDKFLDAEAMRVLQLSQQWEPAVIGGIYTESYKLQPIVFKLSDK